MCGQVRWIILCVTWMFLSIASPQNAQLEGSLVTCDKEGQPVVLPISTNSSCIRCFCKGGIVDCDHQRCPSVDGCHNIIFPPLTSSCCPEVCLGCIYKDAKHESGESWSDSSDPCVVHTCQGGIVTRSRRLCLTSCKDPVHVPGQCCPQCASCWYRGKLFAQGLAVRDTKDPCVICRCNKGSIVCSKTACPVLNCPSKYTVKAKEDCCPRCVEKRSLVILPNQCFFFPLNRVFETGQIIVQEACRTCACEAGTVICDSKTCPRLMCHPEDSIPPVFGECCPSCPLPKQRCLVQGRHIKHGESWHRDRCSQCLCDNGTTHCTHEDCSAILEHCPKQTHELQYIEGRCCPECVEISATCVVFGDPHYRTFDGLLYTFQGACHYILAQQCSSRHRSFSIRVQNAAWPDKRQYTYTNFVIITMNNLKVTLHQRLRVTVNNRSTELPFIKLGHMSIIQRGYTLVVTMSLGITIIWDGLSYLEVTVPQKYKDKMCGLCGNYNGNSSDEFVGKGNVLFSNAFDFGSSWQRGDTCQTKQSAIPCDPASKSLAEKSCAILHGPGFKECQNLVDIDSHYKLCVQTLCTCPTINECLCGVIRSLEESCNTPSVASTVTDICYRSSRL